MAKESGKSTDMLSGLTKKEPPGTDGSGTKGGHTINKEPTRTAVGGQPPTLGPRAA